MMADLIWPTDENGWPSFVNRPPAGNTVKNLTASFKEKTVANYWQWDFRHASPVVSQQNGKLSLSGEVTATNPTGMVLTVRPVSTHFDMTTTVSNANAAVKGLSFYGDANAAIGVGAMNDWVEFWIVKDNKRRVIATEHIKPGVPVQLKFSMLPDLTCEVFYKQAGSAWQPLGGKEDIGFLPQWDRSPRAGLHVKGGKDDVAEFSGFEIVNK
ncbi:hypothetical protein MKQ70_07815 [Chitinophaga sedimenti]|uniref:hypothetical protein n=1 Tax=Chitinophaga sedimenti TaxID=2033606 RepID=UPI00200692B6|nr:hypothetical protein [Chitinophaga sedimenti]MCK7554916.1 hypothetical protein [Chitinophaga sedimenti]